MSKQANKTLIGAFVVGAIALVVTGIIIFGSGDFFAERPVFVMFFEGSVNGLNVGAPVTFRGVKIGTVTEVALYFNPDELKFKIPVYVELETDRLRRETGPPDENSQRYKYLKLLIDRGLRAKLQLQSLVTGLLMVELDFYPDKPARLTGYDKRYHEIPTISSGLDQMMKKVEKLPIDELVNKLTSAIEGIDKAVNSPKLAESMNSVNIALKEISQIADKINEEIGPIATGVNTTVQEVKELVQNLDSRVTVLSKDLDDTIKQSTATLKNLQQATAPGSSVNYQLATTLKELSAAAKSLRQLADMLEQNPETLLRGKKDKGGY
jgi:phospholipid/cholesterol/gamma-HCH transport system substrate-binding protein